MHSNTHPVNVLKFCPRCGSAHFHAVENFSFKCSNCSFNLFVNSSGAVAVLLFNEKKELLFTHRAIEPHIGKLDLPGGFIDPMETGEQAAIREIQEELGIQIHSLKYMFSFPNEYIFSGYSVFTIDLVFQAKSDELQKMKAMDDISAFEFLNPNDLDIEKLPFVSLRNIIQKLIRHEGNY